MKIEVKIKNFKDGSKEFKCSCIDPVFDENKSENFEFTLSLQELNEIENLERYIGGVLQSEVTFKTVETQINYDYDPQTGVVIPITKVDILPASGKRKRSNQ